MATKLILTCALVLSAAFSAPAEALSSRTCNPVVPATIKYRPRYAGCNGKAAILLSGKYRRAFSVVFKKVDHNDRLANNCPDASCSPFKTQRTVIEGNTRVACFGAAGDSAVFRGYDPDFGFNSAYVVKWISIKLRNSGKLEDVEIYCLPKPYPMTPIN